MQNKVLVLIFALFSTITSYGQQFKASANGSTGGSLSNHYDYSTTPATLVDSRVSTSTPTGFTSPAVVTTLHFNGKDFAGSYLGGLQFGTGSQLSGSLAGTALFKADQSYVTLSTNGDCGIFKTDGSCKNNGFVPNTSTMFVGIFEGIISWQTLADNSHVIRGTVKGVINAKGPAVFMSFTATTVPDGSPFTGNGHLRLATITLQAFDQDGN